MTGVGGCIALLEMILMLLAMRSWRVQRNMHVCRSCIGSVAAKLAGMLAILSGEYRSPSR